MKDLVCPRAVLSSRQVALCGRMRPSSKFPVWATFSDDIKLFSPRNSYLPKIRPQKGEGMRSSVQEAMATRH